MSFVLSVGYSAILSSGDLFPLLTDGALLSHTVGILALRGRDTVRVAKFRGHDTGDMVRNGRGASDRQDWQWSCRCSGWIGKASSAWTDVRRNVIHACDNFYRTKGDLRRSVIAMSRCVVNADGTGGTAPQPTFWCSGAAPKKPALKPLLETLPGVLAPPLFGLERLATWDWHSC